MPWIIEPNTSGVLVNTNGVDVEIELSGRLFLIPPGYSIHYIADPITVAMLEDMEKALEQETGNNM